MFIGKQRTEKKTRDFQTVIKVRALFWFDHFGIFDWIYQFSAGKIQFFRCVSVAYFILMVFRYNLISVFIYFRFTNLLNFCSPFRYDERYFFASFICLSIFSWVFCTEYCRRCRLTMYSYLKTLNMEKKQPPTWSCGAYKISTLFFFFGFLFVSYFIFILFGWNGEKRKIKI